MKRLIPFLVAVGSVALMGATASAANLDQSSGSTAGAVAESQAEQAAVNSDWTQVAILAAKSYREGPSVANEFNLATAYTHSGETTLAIPLYADVAANGQYTTVVAQYDYRSGPRPARVSYNMTDEANRRLVELTGQPYDLTAPVDGGPSLSTPR